MPTSVYSLGCDAINYFKSVVPYLPKPTYLRGTVAVGYVLGGYIAYKLSEDAYQCPGEMYLNLISTAIGVLTTSFVLAILNPKRPIKAAFYTSLPLIPLFIVGKVTWTYLENRKQRLAGMGRSSDSHALESACSTPPSLVIATGVVVAGTLSALTFKWLGVKV